MKKIIVPILSLLMLSCSAPVEEEKHNIEVKSDSTMMEVYVDSVPEPKEVPNPEAKEPSVVTPEFWENFKTDITAIVFFTKKDTLPSEDEQLVMSVEQNFVKSGLNFYQVLSSDSASMVFLNDTLVFDFTEYKYQFGEGYVLLKPGAMPYAFALKDDIDYSVNEINSYFE